MKVNWENGDYLTSRLEVYNIKSQFSKDTC